MDKNIETIRTETAQALGVSIDKVDYLAEEHLADPESATPADLSSGDARGRILGNRWGTFGTNLQVRGNMLYYECGNKSNNPQSYACDHVNGKLYYVSLDTLLSKPVYVDDCRLNNRTVWFIGNYDGANEWNMVQQ